MKIAACLGFMILGIIIDCGGVPTDDRGYIGAKYWYVHVETIRWMSTNTSAQAQPLQRLPQWLPWILHCLRHGFLRFRRN